MHQESVPRAARQHPAERSQQHSVVRLESRLPSLPAEDRQLVAEHENLQFLRSVAASDEHDQLQQPADDDVQGWRKHSDLQQTGGTPDATAASTAPRLTRSGFRTPRAEPEQDVVGQAAEVMGRAGHGKMRT
jgi:hypothetical protein